MSKVVDFIIFEDKLEKWGFYRFVIIFFVFLKLVKELDKILKFVVIIKYYLLCF